MSHPATVQEPHVAQALEWLDQASDSFLWIDQTWRIRHVNQAAVQGSGKPRDELLGAVAWDLFPESHSTLFAQRAREAMESGKAVTVEAYYAPLNAWLQVRMVPGPGGMAVYSRNISESRQVLEQLRIRNRQQAAIVHLGQLALSGQPKQAIFDEAVRQVALVLDADCSGVLERHSDAAEFVVRAGIGWNPGIVGSGRIRADIRAPAGYAAITGQPVVVPDIINDTRFGVSPLVSAHGWRSGMAAPILDRSRPYGALCVLARTVRQYGADDVHFLQAVAHLLGIALESHAVEEELRQHRDHLEKLVSERTERLSQSLQAMESFSYAVSHDLRTPLRAIGGFGDLLGIRYGHCLPPEGQRLLAHVRTGARQMGDLVEDLLALARIGTAELVREDLDLSAMAQEILQALSLRFPGRSVRWRIEPGLHVHAQRNLTRIVLENLLGNAWKFTGRIPEAQIAFGQEPGPYGAFWVRDNGAGFDMAFANRLFQPFQRLHNPTEFEGTGIGLATVARIVQRHGGKAWATAEPGHGATFYFTLAQADAAGTAAAKS